MRLKGGCPSTFSRVGSELRALQAAGIPHEMVPGVSSALAAPVLAGQISHPYHRCCLHTGCLQEKPLSMPLTSQCEVPNCLAKEAKRQAMLLMSFVEVHGSEFIIVGRIVCAYI